MHRVESLRLIELKSSNHSQIYIGRNRRSQMFFKLVFENFVIFTGKHLRWSLLLIALQARPVILLKRGSKTGAFL